MSSGPEALIPEGLEPLAVWDTRDIDGLWRCGGDICMLGEATRWANAHIREATRTYRVEFYLLDSPFAVLYRYKVDDDGRKFALEPGGDALTEEEPVVQMLGELPPAHLLSRP